MSADFPTARPVALEREFRQALRDPETAQRSRLREILRRNADTEYGRRFGFAKISDPREFQSAVPLVSYEDLRPDIERVLEGVPNVLTSEAVLRLHLSSGTTSASKLIPFTRALQEEFSRSIEIWLWNLRDSHPNATSGPSYWVITPGTVSDERWSGALPVEFDQDAAYLPESMQRWFSTTQCVPHGLGAISNQDHFLFLTAVFLLLEGNLALLSFWSPSFWQSLSQFIRSARKDLVSELRSGLKEWRRLCASYELPNSMSTTEHSLRRAGVVENAGENWQEIWPHLSLISAWADGFAADQIGLLRNDFPQASIQGKGLLATEGIVTIPFSTRSEGEVSPVLVPNAHFYEFRSAGTGKILLAHELAQQEEYEVIITTGGGLYRYRLGDRVFVDGVCGSTPRLRFLGKTEKVSDLCGEKLHEDHVKRSLERILSESALAGRFVLLAPSVSGVRPRYRLFAESPISPEDRRRLGNQVERALAENFNYALCRRNGQLDSVEVQVVTEQAPVVYRDHKSRLSRLSTVKMSCFDTETGWEGVFST